MTSQDHNKVIGIMHLIYGGFNALMMIIFVPFFLMVSGIIASDPNAPPGVTAIFGFFSVFMLVFAFIFGLPPILAGYAMLRRKSWARVAGIVSACLCAMSFPFGTALCVYSLWFLFGQEGERFYKGGETAQNRYAPPLRDANTFDWEAQRASDTRRQREYVPPPQPPDWRGQ
ncbi:MAG: hypothetical protein QOC99_1848 [Acidobacteriota bacterium]|jgi:hypothetical protein|nr:hypothetical protein [Acidobacteriota bacterium]